MEYIYHIFLAGGDLQPPHRSPPPRLTPQLLHPVELTEVGKVGSGFKGMGAHGDPQETIYVTLFVIWICSFIVFRVRVDKYF